MGPAIVFQYVKLVFVHSYDVDAHDVGIDATSRVHSQHFRHKGFILDDEV